MKGDFKHSWDWRLTLDFTSKKSPTKTTPNPTKWIQSRKLAKLLARGSVICLALDTASALCPMRCTVCHRAHRTCEPSAACTSHWRRTPSDGCCQTPERPNWKAMVSVKYLQGAFKVSAEFHLTKSRDMNNNWRRHEDYAANPLILGTPSLIINLSEMKFNGWIYIWERWK